MKGSLSIDDGDGNGNENGKNAICLGLQLCTCITLFCTFLCRRCTTTTSKCLISRFEQDVNTIDDSLFLFLNFDTVLQNSTPEKFANVWRVEQDRIKPIKFEAAQIYFSSDVFVAVAVVFFKLSNKANETSYWPQSQQGRIFRPIRVIRWIIRVRQIIRLNCGRKIRLTLSICFSIKFD